jgi:hypothetical protein
MSQDLASIPSQIDFYRVNQFSLVSRMKNKSLNANFLLEKLLQARQVLKLRLPERFIVKHLSAPSNYSSVVTLCLSGFATQNEDYDAQFARWSPLIRKFCGEVFTLDWRCSTVGEFTGYIIEKLGIQIASRLVIPYSLPFLMPLVRGLTRDKNSFL